MGQVRGRDVKAEQKNSPTGPSFNLDDRFPFAPLSKYLLPPPFLPDAIFAHCLRTAPQVSYIPT